MTAPVFADLVGQDAVVKQLGDAVAGRGMTHAWLFTGPPGSGRSNAARAFAAALQCEHGGCGDCDACHQALGGTHPDVAIVVPEGLHLLIADARRVIDRASRAPVRGRWQITVIEDADRMEERTSNTILKVVEEPPPHSVLLLCAPSIDDVLPTIRSRCRLVPLVVPSAEAVARHLVGTGVDPAMAAFAARAAQGHIGRARRLATDEAARNERQHVLALPGSLARVDQALAAAKDLFDAAEADAKALAAERDETERESLAAALGAGATGKGLSGATPRGGAGALKELERRQKSRYTRTLRDALDRALIDLAAFYRDVLALQLGAAAVPVHVDLTAQAESLARGSSPEDTLRRLDAVLACRTAIDENVNPQLAVEAMALALRSR
jgi:DNA polymerase-3 subunit delta'